MSGTRTVEEGVGAARREELRLPVDEGLAVAATAVHPDRAPRALVWCVPGGGVDRRYWDLPVPGAAPDDYSFAHRVAAAGYLVVVADHLGAGGSTRPGPVDQDTVADTMSRAVTEARRQLGVTSLPSAGVAHSMGCGFTLHRQERHRDHDALVITGWSNLELMLPQTDGERRPVGAPDGTPDMRRHNHGVGVTDAVLAANRAIRTDIPQPALGWVIAPGRLAAAARRVDVPVLLVHGAEDVTPDPAADAALYERAPSVETVHLPTSHHWHTGSPDRHLLADAVAGWLDRTLRVQTTHEPTTDQVRGTDVRGSGARRTADEETQP